MKCFSYVIEKYGHNIIHISLIFLFMYFQLKLGVIEQYYHKDFNHNLNIANKICLSFKMSSKN